MTGLQHFNKEQKSNPQSHVKSPFPNSLEMFSGLTRRKVGIISGLGSLRGRFGDHFRVGDHFGVGIISGAVQIFFQSFSREVRLSHKLLCGCCGHFCRHLGVQALATKTERQNLIFCWLNAKLVSFQT